MVSKDARYNSFGYRHKLGAFNGIMHKNIDNEYDHMIIAYSSFTRSPLHDHNDEACVLSGLIVLEYF